MNTVQERLRWILDNLDDPKTKRRWKGKPLARAAKLPSESHVSMILTGEIKEPKRPVLRAIAEAASVPVSWLADGEGPLPTPSGKPAELHVERDPTPALVAPPDASPLVGAVAEAFDKSRHSWDDGNAVIKALHEDIDAHLAVDVDLIEKARVWLDAAASLRREGKSVTAGTLLDRVTLGKSPRAGSDAPDAFQREINEIAASEGVTFGSAAQAVEAFRQSGKKKGAGE